MMLFAASSTPKIAYLAGWLIGGFLAGLFFGLLPYFLARWRRPFPSRASGISGTRVVGGAGACRTIHIAE